MKENKYPAIRHLTSYESMIAILNSGFILSRKHINKNFNEKWIQDRNTSELNKFKTQDLIFCSPDWYNDLKHETGHGSCMIYFKQTIFDDFKITFTESDSKIHDLPIHNTNEIKSIYSIIKSKNTNKINSNKATKNIIGKYETKNKEQVYNTSRGRQFMKSLFYKEYSEFQIHTEKIPITYIEKIILTDNYFHRKTDDNILKNKVILLSNKLQIKHNPQ